VDPPPARWLSGSIKLDDDQAAAALIANRGRLRREGLPGGMPRPARCMAV